MLGIIGLLALTVLWRGFIADLGADMSLDFSLRQAPAESGPAQTADVSGRALAAPRSEPAAP